MAGSRADGPSAEAEPAPRDERLTRADGALAAVLLALVLVVYGSTRQTWLFGDGPFLLDAFLADDPAERTWYHALYLPAARLLAPFVPARDQAEPLRWLSVVAGALAASGSYLFARGLGAPRRGAAAAAALLAALPSAWFFGTTVEVHALQCAGAVLAACATLLVPWRKPALGLAVSCAAYATAYGAHQTNALLGLGWIALVQLARRRRGQGEFSTAQLLLVVGPALLASLGAAVALGALLRDLSPIGSAASSLETIGRFGTPLTLAWMRDELLDRYWILIALALAGACSIRGRRVAPAMALLVLPPWIFFVAWTEPTLGGYFLGSAPFAAALASFCPLPRSGPRSGPRWGPRWGPRSRLAATGAAAAIALVVGVQAWRSCGAVLAREGTVSVAARERRAERVREVLGERGCLLAFDAAEQPIRLHLPHVREWNLAPFLPRYVYAGHGRAEFAERMCQVVGDLWRVHGGRLAIDAGYRNSRGVSPVIDAYLDAMESALGERFALEERADPAGGEWPLILVRSPAGSPAPAAGEGAAR